MSTIPVVEPLVFTRLNSIMSVYDPARPPAATDPTTIIICEWMGIPPKSRSLNSIFTQYHALYPTSRIITIRSLPSAFLTTSTSSRYSLTSPIISALNSDPTPEPRILVHIFSNGGALSFCDVCHVYKSQTGKTLHVKAVVLDSAPGQPNLTEEWIAVSFSLPKGLLWYPAAAAAAAWLGVDWLSKNVLGLQSLVDKNFDKLNDGNLVDANAKRLYVYSEADRLVGWRDVERHAEDAKVKGFGTPQMLKETKSAHVRHLFDDGETYWNMIGEVWNSSGRYQPLDTLQDITAAEISWLQNGPPRSFAGVE